MLSVVWRQRNPVCSSDVVPTIFYGNIPVVQMSLSRLLRDRIARLCQMHRIDEEAAEEMIEKADKRRSEYYNYYSYKTWGAAATYHLCVDSSSLGIEETVRFVEEFVAKKLQIGM